MGSNSDWRRDLARLCACSSRAKGRRARLAAAIALAYAAAAPAATIFVDSSASTSAAGKCSLFDAVTSLNTSSTASGSTCTAGDGDNDTIDLNGFTAPTTIDFTQSSGTDPDSALVISKPVSIVGSLAGNQQPLVTIQRDPATVAAFRLIHTTADLTLHGLALTNGSDKGTLGGGAILGTNNATIALVNSVITGNQTSLQGGAIYDAGGPSTVTLTDSAISGNIASGYGGGIAGDFVYSTRSTISGNYSISGASGVYATSKFGCTNSTISNNTVPPSARDGAILAFAATLEFCTIAANTLGGIEILNASTATATIIHGNTSSGGIDVSHLASVTVALSGNNNLIGSHSGTVTIPPDTTSCDPNLIALSDDGGPTQTQALPVGSCAVNAGPATAPTITTDQRGVGYVRLEGSATDIGAFELQPDHIFANGFDP